MEALSEIFGLLSKERRRYALYYLEQADGPVHVDELTEKVSEWESDPPEPAIPEGEYEETILTLKHSHLPKAAEAEYIDYDPTSGFVEISGSPPEFKAVLHVAEAIEHPEHQDITSLT